MVLGLAAAVTVIPADVKNLTVYDVDTGRMTVVENVGESISLSAHQH